jgi:hypothetical protein
MFCGVSLAQLTPVKQHHRLSDQLEVLHHGPFPSSTRLAMLAPPASTYRYGVPTRADSAYAGSICGSKDGGWAVQRDVGGLGRR